MFIFSSSSAPLLCRIHGAGSNFNKTFFLRRFVGTIAVGTVPIVGFRALVAGLGATHLAFVPVIVKVVFACVTDLSQTVGTAPQDLLVALCTATRTARPRSAFDVLTSFAVPVIGPKIAFGTAPAHVGPTLAAGLVVEETVGPALRARYLLALCAGPGMIHFPTETAALRR